MSVFSKFPRTFWVANAIELLERWAWYGFFMLFATYLTGSSDQGGLEFSQSQKGWIMGVGTGILYFLPVLTGAIADRYGYKKVLMLSFIIYASAFVLFPVFSSFTGVFLIYLYLAFGAALFKPVISATIAKTTTEETASIGFGLFYMMVNIGGFLGPIVALQYKGSNLAFYISAIVILFNFVLLFFYNEPDRNTVIKDRSLIKTFGQIFRNMFAIVQDRKFLIFLIIVAGFWTMYNQLFFTLPVFIEQWVDTSVLFNFFYQYIPFITDRYSAGVGVMDPEFIVSMDSLYIIAFQILVSGIVMRMKPLKSMMTGFLVCSIGMSLTLVSQNVLFTLVAILIFALGEMAGSPKITEYIGRIAPPDKKALYMGYSFIPVFLGTILAGFISGDVYQRLSDKVTFVQQFAMEHNLQVPEGLSKDAYFANVAGQLNLSSRELTNILWETYSPSRLWMVILGIGLIAVIALYIYDKTLIRQDNSEEEN
ncbi:MAG: MFS transporter [Tannerellaceae bacterium]|nr:MFS transporter [Tannerellaceae bacterium]